MGILACLGVLRTPLRVLSSIYLLSTPLRTPHKLSVRRDQSLVSSTAAGEQVVSSGFSFSQKALVQKKREVGGESFGSCATP